MTAHPRARLDDLVHQPVRFSLLAGLAQADWLEFRFLRDTLELSDSLCPVRRRSSNRPGMSPYARVTSASGPVPGSSSLPKAAPPSTTTSAHCGRSSKRRPARHCDSGLIPDHNSGARAANYGDDRNVIAPGISVPATTTAATAASFTNGPGG